MIAVPFDWPHASPILTAAQMRAAELETAASGTSLSVLMDRAGAALAELAWRTAAGRDLLILAGPGNNGGDGYVAARLLAERGGRVRVAGPAVPRTELAKAAAAGFAGEIEQLTSDTATAPVIIDALYGTGGRPLDAEIYAKAQRLTNAAARVIAADLPSGLDADGGALRGPALRANISLAFSALKPAHLLFPAAQHCGRLLIADLGIAASSTVYRLGMPELSEPAHDAHKYARGMVAVVAGSMAGAAELAARAALRSGAGYTVLHGSRLPPGPPHALVRRSLPDAGAWDARLGAIVIGPGLGQGERARAVFASAAATALPLVVDADALPLFRPGISAAPTILTPHAGEFARIAPRNSGNKLADTLIAAERLQAVIIHKGADTVIAAPDGRAVIAARHSHWLAAAGTGDVLAGICGAMLARGLDAFAAACAAVALHGRAADRAGQGLIADDLVREPIWP
jgi:ADP-dependent NAD(P)H-hydrate dehydratase / NAD(P)H-hydrate epimerase